MKLEELILTERVNELVLALKPHEGRWDYAVYVNGTIRTAAREAAVAAIERAAIECDVLARSDCAAAIRALRIEE